MSWCEAERGEILLTSYPMACTGSTRNRSGFAVCLPLLTGWHVMMCNLNCLPVVNTEIQEEEGGLVVLAIVTRKFLSGQTSKPDNTCLYQSSIYSEEKTSLDWFPVSSQ